MRPLNQINPNDPIFLEGKVIERYMKGREESAKWFALHHLKTALQKTNMTATEIVAKAKANRDDTTVIEDMIDLAMSGETPSEKMGIQSAMRALLKRNGFRDLPNYEKVYRAEHIEGYNKLEATSVIHNIPMLRHRLAGYIANVSGFRRNDILGLQVRHIKEDFETGQTYLALRLDPKEFLRVKAPGYSFIGPTEVALIKQLNGQGIIDLDKPDSWILPGMKRGRINDHMDEAGLHGVLQRAISKSGITRRVQPLHGFRKYYESVLDQIPNSRISVEQRDMLEGHYSKRRPIAYRPHNWEPLRPIYAEMYPLLDIETTITTLPAPNLPNEDVMRQITAMTEAFNRVNSKLEALEAENKRLRELPK